MRSTRPSESFAAAPARRARSSKRTHPGFYSKQMNNILTDSNPNSEDEDDDDLSSDEETHVSDSASSTKETAKHQLKKRPDREMAKSRPTQIPNTAKAPGPNAVHSSTPSKAPSPGRPVVRTVQQLVHMANASTIDFYHGHPGVSQWDREHMGGFINSLLSGLFDNLPMHFYCFANAIKSDNGIATHKRTLFDGRARLRALQMFLNGAISCPDENGHPVFFSDHGESGRILIPSTAKWTLCEKEIICYEWNELKPEQQKDVLSRLQPELKSASRVKQLFSMNESPNTLARRTMEESVKASAAIPKPAVASASSSSRGITPPAVAQRQKTTHIAPSSVGSLASQKPSIQEPYDTSGVQCALARLPGQPILEHADSHAISNMLEIARAISEKRTPQYQQSTTSDVTALMATTIKQVFSCFLQLIKKDSAVFTAQYTAPTSFSQVSEYFDAINTMTDKSLSLSIMVLAS